MSDEEDEVKHQCVHCSNEYPEDELHNTNDNDYVCSDCVRTCEHCDWVGSEGNDWYSVGNQYWCETCWSDDSFTCQRCDECYNGDRISSGRVEDMGEYWCEYCLSDYANYCDECDNYNSDSCDCSDSRSGQVHQYSYKPNPAFTGVDRNNLYMGFELEMEFPTASSDEYTRAIQEVVPLEEDNVCYLKADGSIRGLGFELVTHPHTLGAYEQADSLWNYIERLRTTYGARSWDTDTCGLHVHVSRNAFRSGAHTHRFLSLIYRNPREMMKLAGRKNSQYAQFSDVYKPDEWGIPRFNLRDKVHRNRGYNTERYSAVNTNNDYTLELRFFRGNMKREGIMSALELCHASAEYTRNLSISDVKLGALKWEWFYDWVEANNGIYPNLYTRMSKVPSVSLDNRPLLNA
jgi:hypothetical protein